MKSRFAAGRYTIIGAFAFFTLCLFFGQGCSDFFPTSGSGSLASQSVRKCPPPSGVTSRPVTIEDAVNLINALPKPTSVACFLESLERPLNISLTRNEISGQPAQGFENPRIFILSGDLIISVVPAGIGAQVVEFSKVDSERTSIKAELKFPVSETLPLSAPYDHIRDGSRTVCAGCHSGETRVSEIKFADAFSSVAFRPRPETLVNLDWFRKEYAACRSAGPSNRCEIINALFDHGALQSKEFPTTFPVF